MASTPRLEFSQAIRNARKRAALRGTPFTLTAADATTLWARCEGLCEVTGIPFEIEKKGRHEKRAYAPSLDRRDNAKGYELETVRVVCVAVNVAMNTWGEDVLYRIANSILVNRKMPHLLRQGAHHTELPKFIRAYRGARRITYGTRVLNKNGKLIDLPRSATIEEAVAARTAWMRAQVPSGFPEEKATSEGLEIIE